MKGQINWRTILVALAMGLFLGYGLQEYVSSRPQEMVSQLAPVVVARMNISPGTVLRRGSLDVVQWPREFLPPQSATTIPEVEGRIVINFITKGEPVLLPKLVPLDKQRHQLKINKIMAWGGQ
jgi:Flp pilus assembly protein CpaB